MRPCVLVACIIQLQNYKTYGQPGAAAVASVFCEVRLSGRLLRRTLVHADRFGLRRCPPSQSPPRTQICPRWTSAESEGLRFRPADCPPNHVRHGPFYVRQCMWRTLFGGQSTGQNRSPAASADVRRPTVSAADFDLAGGRRTPADSESVRAQLSEAGSRFGRREQHITILFTINSYW